MTRRFRGIVLTLALAIGLAPVAACSGPYAGKAEALKKPRKKKRPPEPDVAALPYNEECKTAFFEDNSKVRRDNGAARGKIAQGDAALGTADTATDAGTRATMTIEAIAAYKKALLDDQFSPEATYKLASAYARVRKKKCATDLLTRLAELKKNPEFEREAKRMIQAVSQDSAFEGFRKDADSALGI